MPGVEAAAISLTVPGGGEDYPQQFGIVGRDTDSQGQQIFADSLSVSPDFFRVLGIPLLAGETCRLHLDGKTPPSLMVNRSFVDRYMAGLNPVQQHLRFGKNEFEIAGVVSDVHDHGYARDPHPAVYFCEMPGSFPDPNYLLKTAANPAALVESVRRRMQALEPNRAVYATKPLTDYLASSLDEKRFQTMLLSLFGLTALLLASVGLYGVTSFSLYRKGAARSAFARRWARNPRRSWRMSSVKARR